MGEEDSKSSDAKSTSLLPEAVIKSFERLLERHDNDSTNVGLLLFAENKELRDQNRALQGKVPKEGSVVLSTEEATAWNAYQALGSPADLQKTVDDHATLQGSVAQMQRESLLNSIAEQVGFKPKVLAQLDRMAKAQGKDLAFSTRETTNQDGKAIPVAYVKDGTLEKPLTDYAESEWADFLPSLRAAAPSGNGAPALPAPRFPTQHPGSSAPPPDLVTQILNEQAEARAKQVNPLLPP